MKKSLLSIIKSVLLLSTFLVLQSASAQAPQKMSYQAVIRNASNTLVANANVGVKVSILQTTATGTSVYSETHQPTTNTNVLATFEIGNGTVISGNFAAINWANGPYFIKTETDPTGGTNYTISGTSQLLSVPFALYAASGNPGPQGIQGVPGTTGPQGPIGLTGAAGPQGPQGPIGLTGATGPQGIPGATGAQGIPGSANINGTTNRMVKFTNATTGGDSQIVDNGTIVKIQPTNYTGLNPELSKVEISGSNNSLRLVGSGATYGEFGKLNFGDIDRVFISEDIDDSMQINSFGRTAITGGNVGIGTITPTEKLDVNGKTKTTNLQVTTGAGTGKILTSDVAGNASWQTNNSWQTIGNAGTNPTTNFIGTTDNADVVFKRQNIISGKIGSSNTSFGLNSSGSSTGLNNTSIGAYSQNQISTSNSNTSVGSSSLENNSLGSQNTAIGTKALQGNISESNNVAVGFETLLSNSGAGGTAIGSKALRSNTSGDLNVAVGTNALFANTDGYENTVVGSNAADNNITGVDNVAVGISALGTNQFGSFNTAIGAFAYNSGGLDNSTALGYNSVITASNQVRIGNASVTTIGGFTSWTNVSDARFKKNIQQNVPGLKFITKLRPVTYNLDLNSISIHNKTPERLRDFNAEKVKESQIQSGFIAQEVEQAAKELGYEFSGVDAPKNENDYYGLRYAEFVVPMVKAIQELEEENQLLKNQNLELEKRLKAIEEKLSK